MPAEHEISVPAVGGDFDGGGGGAAPIPAPVVAPVAAATALQHVSRLTRCPLCSLPLLQPITLPCGRTICRRCLPEPRPRANISYPSTPTRLQGFDCPFPDCRVEHASEDCGVDVTLSKLMGDIRGALKRARHLGGEERGRDQTRVSGAGPDRPLEPETDLDLPRTAGEVDVRPLANLRDGDDRHLERGSGTPVAADDDTTLRLLGSAARPDVDCQVCYALFYDAVTTPCGHTFCRHCLHRILDHSDLCAVCRRVLHRSSWPANAVLRDIETILWSDALAARQLGIAAEARHDDTDYDIPLFVCTLSFPTMPTFLHVFEPRYRLMIRRALEHDRTFGMVLYRTPSTPAGPDFFELGTLLRIVNVEFFPDGRSLLETVGVSRFRVVRHGMLDGYAVGKIQRVDDVSVAEEENLEATEMRQAAAGRETASSDGIATSGAAELRITPADLDTMATQDLLKYATAFVKRMRDASAAWLTNRMLAIYGDCPENEPAKFPWWFGSILPVNDSEKYRLLGTASVRERLKICCRWILEWEETRW